MRLSVKVALLLLRLCLVVVVAVAVHAVSPVDAATPEEELSAKIKQVETMRASQRVRAQNDALRAAYRDELARGGVTPQRRATLDAEIKKFSDLNEKMDKEMATLKGDIKQPSRFFRAAKEAVDKAWDPGRVGPGNEYRLKANAKIDRLSKSYLRQINSSEPDYAEVESALLNLQRIFPLTKKSRDAVSIRDFD